MFSEELYKKLRKVSLVSKSEHLQNEINRDLREFDAVQRRLLEHKAELADVQKELNTLSDVHIPSDKLSI